MKIKGSTSENNDFYSDELRESAAKTFQLATRIAQIKELLTSIKEKAESLDAFFLTEQEQAENENATRAFDHKMQNMMCATFHNLERYQTHDWKELFDSEEG